MTVFESGDAYRPSKRLLAKRQARVSRYRLALVVSAAAVLGLGLTAATAQATCFSSVPSSASLPDEPTDAPGNLEIVSVDFATDSSCGITMNPVLAAQSSPGDLLSGEFVGTFINTDGNLATGSPAFFGAEKVVTVMGLTGPDPAPTLVTWTGSDFDLASATSLPPLGAAGFVTNLNQLGVPAPTTLKVVVWAQDGSDIDFAPDTPWPYSFPVDFSTTPPLPPPPPPAPPVTADTTAPRMSIKSRGTVRVGSNGVVPFTLSCPSSEPGGCTGKVTLKSRGKVRVSTSGADTARKRARKRKVTLGSKSFRIAGGKSAVVKVRLSKKNGRLLRKLRRIRARATVKARDTAGNARTRAKNVTLKAAKKRKK